MGGGEGRRGGIPKRDKGRIILLYGTITVLSPSSVRYTSYIIRVGGVERDVVVTTRINETGAGRGKKTVINS